MPEPVGRLQLQRQSGQVVTAYQTAHQLEASHQTAHQLARGAAKAKDGQEGRTSAGEGKHTRGQKPGPACSHLAPSSPARLSTQGSGVSGTRACGCGSRLAEEPNVWTTCVAAHVLPRPLI
eukprot:352409-Chlamydomonas_euryale.AAC.1